MSMAKDTKKGRGGGELCCRLFHHPPMQRRQFIVNPFGLLAAVWTGMLLLASLLHLQEFDANNPRVCFWFFAYLLFLAPQTMTQVWPWKASVLLLQIYAGRRTLQ